MSCEDDHLRAYERQVNSINGGCVVDNDVNEDNADDDLEDNADDDLDGLLFLHFTYSSICDFSELKLRDYSERAI